MKKLRSIILVAGFISAVFLNISEADSFNGYFKNYDAVFDFNKFNNPSLYPEKYPGLMSNRLRLNYSSDISETLAFIVSYDIFAKIQDNYLVGNSVFPAASNASDYRIGDINSNFYSQDNAGLNYGLFQNLDRFFVSWKTGDADMIFGRQPVAWGSAKVINPTDIIAPFTFEALDKEDRTGVDALRCRVPSGLLGEYDMGVVFGRNLEDSKNAYFLRKKFNTYHTDFAVTVVGFQKDLLLGIDIAGSLKGAGVWFEGAYVDENAGASEDKYARVTAGADYNFNNKLYGFLEYHYNGIGSDNPDNYGMILNNPAAARGAVYLLGRHYLIPGFTYQLTPLLAFTGQSIINIGDSSALFSPGLEYNLSENTYFSVGGFISIGKTPDNPAVTPGLTVYRSEFGAYPDMYFTSLRTYF